MSPWQPDPALAFYIACVTTALFLAAGLILWGLI